MIKAILGITAAALGIWQSKEAKKYSKKLYDLEKAYDEESDKPNPDFNVLDRIERDILRHSQLIALEIKGSQIAGKPD